MIRTLTVTWLLLMILTMATGLIIFAPAGGWPRLPLILFLSGVKFLLVSFYFLELRTAHAAWKFLILAFVSIVFIFLALNS